MHRAQFNGGAQYTTMLHLKPCNNMARTLHACDRCGQQFTRRDYLVKHLSRKSPCEERYDSAHTIAELRDIAASGGKRKTEECPCCGKMFVSMESLRYHRRENCCCMTADDPVALVGLALVQEQLEHVRQQVLSLSSLVQPPQVKLNPQNPQGLDTDKVVNNTHNTHHNTYHNTHTSNSHIVLNDFGQETRAHMQPTFLHQCVKRRDKGLLELLEKLHFSQDAQSNRNVKCTSVKRREVMVHEDGMWRYKQKDRVARTMVDNGHDIMQEHFEDNEDILREEVSPTMFDAIQGWLDTVRKDDKRTVKALLIDVYNLIKTYSNSSSKATVQL